MHFPKHWFSAQRGQVSAWGWSDESLTKAQDHAESRLLRILEWLRYGEGRQLQRYGYSDRPLREEVLKEFRASDGTLAGAVSRNSYGCLVLNTSHLMFVDIDAPETKTSNFLGGLFGFRKSDKNKDANDFEAGVLEKVHRWVTGRPQWGWRVYRTRSGIRLTATHQPIASDETITNEAFETFSSDPLYRKLCATQKCFRARLTPKPWRCGIRNPRQRWPFRDEKSAAQFSDWNRRYAAAIENHAVCRLIGHFGNPEVHPELRELVAFHDCATRIETSLKLA